MRLHYIAFIFLAAISFAGCKASRARVVRGDISGKVIDGSTGLPIAGADVYSLVDVSGAVTTDASGNYYLDNLLAMVHTLHAETAGYIPQEMDTRIYKDTLVPNFNFILLPTAYAADRVIAVLTWGADPPDLDSHLWVPDTTPREISYMDTGDIAATPWALLDVDDTTSFGPETMAIRLSVGSPGTPDFPGTYRYFVHNYTGTPAITTSGAQVRVYVDGTLAKTYNVPTSGTGEYWHVFDMVGTTITDVNVLDVNPIAAPP